MDARKPINQLPHIEGRLRNTFLGSRHYLACELLTHGNEIAAPEFAVPASSVGLEILDFFDFFVARNLLHKHQSVHSELPLSRLGKCYHMVIMEPNNVDYFVGADVLGKYIPS